MSKRKADGILESDAATLSKFHQFVRDDKHDEEHRGDWRIRMARKYYDKLYKEFAIADLSQYESGNIGLRFRTEKEVISGRGQYSCGSKHCVSVQELHSYELPFQYIEEGVKKIELVKV